MDAELRPPFHRRLLVALGGTLGLALAVLGILVWLGAYAGLTYGVHAIVDAEAREAASHIVRPDGRLDVNAYDWAQPHHRFLDPRIDPFFMRVFDRQGILLRASDNVALLGGPLPPPDPTVSEDLLRPFQPFEVGRRRLYAITRPLVGPNGVPLGFIEVARYDPGLRNPLFRLGLGLGAGFLVVWAALLALTWAVGRRVVRPLEGITASAAALTAGQLGERVPVPPDADRETAELADALNLALGRIEDTFREMRRFTADAAHELQTPLTVMIGHADVALRRKRAPDAYRETLSLLRTELEGLALMVRGLLALARLDQAQQDLDTTIVDLVRLVRDEVEAVRPRAEEHGLELQLTADNDLLVLGHDPLLRDVVRNLLDNALKYTSEGEVAVAITRDGDQARLVVSDTGSGIPADDLAHVTSRFYRSPSVQHVPGSGLGLALVQQVVRHHDGMLSVASTAGTGTTVTVTLSLYRVPVLPDLVPA